MLVTQKNYKLKTLSALILVAQFCALGVHAESKSAPEEYKFNTLGSPAYGDEKTNIQFKAVDPATGDKRTADPVGSVENEKPFKTYLGYPRYQLEVGYAPVSTGFKQEYNSLPLNFSATSFASAYLTGRFQVSPNFYAEVEYSHAEFGVSDKDLGTYKVTKSKANIDTFLARSIHCNIFDQASDKFCYGLVVGLDAYPSLNFANATDIQISSIKDMVAGLHLGYGQGLSPFIALDSSLEYLMGLKLGQDSNLGVDSDSRIIAKLDLHFMNQKDLDYFSLGGVYGYRDAKIHGNTGSFIDNWATKASSFSINASYTWTWQSK